MKIMVYFANGNKAKLDADKVVFVHASEMLREKDILRENSGAAIINRDTICFIKEVPEEKEDD